MSSIHPLPARDGSGSGSGAAASAAMQAEVRFAFVVGCEPLLLRLVLSSPSSGVSARSVVLQADAMAAEAQRLRLQRERLLLVGFPLIGSVALP